MPLKNAGSQIAFTSIASNTYAAIIVGHVEAGLVWVTQHASDGIHMPITVWSIGGLWTMETDAMACKPLVQSSKDGNELLKQIGPNPLQFSNVNPTLWMKLYSLSWPWGQDGGHPMLWLHFVVQYVLVSAYDPLLSTGSIHT